MTPRESQVAQLVGDGLSYKQIGERLGMAERTVRIHVQAIDRKIASEGSTPYRRVMAWVLKHRAEAA